MGAWPGLLLYCVSIGVIGTAAISLLIPCGQRIAGELWLPAAFALGWGAHCLLLLSSMLLVGHYHPWLLPVATVVGAGVLVGAAAGRLRTAELGGFDCVRPVASSRVRVAYWMLFGVISCKVGMLAQDALNFPFFSWDGRFIWNIKAVILLNEGTVFGESFTDPARVHFHRDYPLMLPAAYLGIYQYAGGVFERMARLFLVVMMAMFLLFFYGALRPRTGRLAALFFAMLLAVVPFRCDYSGQDGFTLGTGVADLPLAFLAFQAFIFSDLAWRRRQGRWLVLAGVMGGLCLLMKNEGVIVITILAAFNIFRAIWSTATGRYTAIRPVVAGLGATALVFLPWLLVKRRLPNLYDESYAGAFTSEALSRSVLRLQPIAGYLEEGISDFRGWEAAWVLYTLLMPVSLYLWRRGSRLYFDGVIAMWAAIYVFVYSVTPLHLGYHMQTSVARLLSHFYPLVLFQLATLLALLLRSALYVNQQGNDTNVEAVMTFGDEEQEEQEELLAVGAGPPALAGTAAATQVPHL